MQQNRLNIDYGNEQNCYIDHILYFAFLHWDQICMTARFPHLNPLYQFQFIDVADAHGIIAPLTNIL